MWFGFGVRVLSFPDYDLAKILLKVSKIRHRHRSLDFICTTLIV